MRETLSSQWKQSHEKRRALESKALDSAQVHPLSLEPHNEEPLWSQLSEGGLVTTGTGG